jgi:isopentenyl diphosphate isomerase/L-lactate dehydrogenase-like FMN-dependent dehydrogenase
VLPAAPLPFPIDTPSSPVVQLGTAVVGGTVLGGTVVEAGTVVGAAVVGAAVVGAVVVGGSVGTVLDATPVVLGVEAGVVVAAGAEVVAADGVPLPPHAARPSADAHANAPRIAGLVMVITPTYDGAGEGVRMGRLRLGRVYNFATAQAQARRVLPKALFDFIDGGADDELTLRRNHAAYQQVSFRPRIGISTPEPDLSTTILGSPLSMPVVLAPCGGSRLIYPDGERALVRAAGGAKTAAVMSTASSASLEDVAAAATGPVWFQLYYRGSRDAMAAVVDRAQEAGFGALFITMDMPLRGNQERVRSNDRVVPPRPTLANALRYGPQLAARPAWTLRYLRDGTPSGVPRPAAGQASAVALGPRSPQPNVTWADVEWLRQRWHGPFVIKGVLTSEDARRSVDAGADAVAVSNHGGRQLDSAPATLRVLPEVRDAVGPRIQVLVDGGVQRGSDVLKALALGADAAMIGRPYLYGLAVGGEDGVTHVLELFRDDLVRNLRLVGRTGVADMDASAIDATELLGASHRELRGGGLGPTRATPEFTPS